MIHLFSQPIVQHIYNEFVSYRKIYKKEPTALMCSPDFIKELTLLKREDRSGEKSESIFGMKIIEVNIFYGGGFKWALGDFVEI